LVVAQIILLSQWFNQKNLVKKTNQKDLVKMVKSEPTCPKWHFDQIGHGGKTTIWGVFLTETPNQKNDDFL
jgi:hypothetical protein